MSGRYKHIEFTYKVQWEISNFSLRPDHEAGDISSPKFEVKCLHATPWTFSLYPKGNPSDGYMQFQISRHFLDKESRKHTLGTKQLKNILVKYNVYAIDGLQRRYFKMQDCYRDCNFSCPTTPAKNFIKLEDFSNKILQNGSLILLCVLMLKVDQTEYLTSVTEENLLLLSENIIGLYTTAKFSNLTMFSHDREQFFVHKCILLARWPSALSTCSALRQTVMNDEIHTSISAETLHFVLTYVYSRGGIAFPEHRKDELMSVALRYGLRDLEQILCDYPIEYSILTDIIVEEFSFSYPLTEVKWDDPSFNRVYIMYTPNLTVSDLIVSFSIASDSKNDYIKISFQFSEFNETIVLLKGSMVLLDAEKKELGGCDFIHTYVTDEKWAPSPFLFKNEILKLDNLAHSIQCEILITENRHDKRVLSKVCRIEIGPRILINNLLSFSENLEQMYLNQRSCDLTLKVEDVSFGCHKCILLARSKRIRHLLTDEEINGMNMVVKTLDDSTPPIIFGKVLLYMYSSRANLDNLDDALKLKDAAVSFGLPLLFKKCNSYISSENFT